MSDRDLISYLDSCNAGRGKYSHDMKVHDKKLPAIINTSAMAGYLWSLSLTPQSMNEISNINSFIINSQRADGLWTYCSVSNIDKIIWMTRSALPAITIKAYEKVKGDKSIFFGDFLHHVVTLYYWLSMIQRIGNNVINEQLKKSLIKAFDFINMHIVAKDDYIRLDFSWEPRITQIRHCNFNDSSAYFYLIASIIKYKKLFPSAPNRLPSIPKLLNYIYHYIYIQADQSIKPYDQVSDSDLNKIIKRPAESIFDKAFLFSYLVEETLK